MGADYTNLARFVRRALCYKAEDLSTHPRWVKKVPNPLIFLLCFATVGGSKSVASPIPEALHITCKLLKIMVSAEGIEPSTY